MLRTLAASATLLVLAACQSSGVVPIGPDTYMISKTGYISGGTTAADLYREAGQFCAKEKRELWPVYETSKDAAAYSYASAEIHFRCLTAGDPELRRPTMLPTLRIETGK